MAHEGSFDVWPLQSDLLWFQNKSVEQLRGAQGAAVPWLKPSINGTKMSDFWEVKK